MLSERRVSVWGSWFGHMLSYSFQIHPVRSVTDMLRACVVLDSFVNQYPVASAVASVSVAACLDNLETVYSHIFCMVLMVSVMAVFIS